MIRFVLGAMACVAVAHADTLTLVDALQRVAQNHPLARALALELEATRWRGRAEAAFAPMSVYLAPMLSDGGSGEELIVQQPLELNGGQRARAALSHARYQLHRAEAKRAQRPADPDCRSVRRRLRLPASLGGGRALCADA
jgi:hypothetical protein